MHILLLRELQLLLHGRVPDVFDEIIVYLGRIINMYLLFVYLSSLQCFLILFG